MEAVAQFIGNYVPGIEWLIGLALLHVILSTIAHIVAKDFKISEWPKFLYMWILFMIGIIAINGVVSVASIIPASDMLTPIANILQALIYAGYFSYYLDNIFKHLNMLGLPVDPGLTEVIKNITGKVRNLIS